MNIKINIPIRNEIHIGAKTQIQDQSIYPVNFRTIKTIVNNPKKPIPLLDVFAIYFSKELAPGERIELLTS